MPFLAPPRTAKENSSYPKLEYELPYTVERGSAFLESSVIEFTPFDSKTHGYLTSIFQVE